MICLAVRRESLQQMVGSSSCNADEQYRLHHRAEELCAQEIEAALLLGNDTQEAHLGASTSEIPILCTSRALAIFWSAYPSFLFSLQSSLACCEVAQHNKVRGKQDPAHLVDVGREYGWHDPPYALQSLTMPESSRPCLLNRFEEFCYFWHTCPRQQCPRCYGA